MSGPWWDELLERRRHIDGVGMRPSPKFHDNKYLVGFSWSESAGMGPLTDVPGGVDYLIDPPWWRRLLRTAVALAARPESEKTPRG